MESHEDTTEPCKTDTDARKSESYCPHYERNTCLIHFKCCDEDNWYPCHKCHNVAVTLIENQHEKGQDYSKPSMDHVEDNSTASSIPEEEENVEAGGFSQAEHGSEPKVAGLQDGASTSGEVEEIINIAGEASDEPRSNGEVYLTGGDVSKRTEENTPQLKVDSSPPSPAGIKESHSVATALDGNRLKCTACKREQGFAPNCESCGRSFASYFCEKCKLLIEKKVDPYHCDDCGICRGNKADHFHCHVCNVCMARSLKENHKCFADRGHDPCAICFEEVFSGAVILPCFHMVHKDCAERLLLSGSRTCPMCRNEIFQDDEDAAGTSEEASSQILSSQESVSRFCQIGQKLSGLPSWVYKWGKRLTTRNASSERDIEMMDNVSETPQ